MSTRAIRKAANREEAARLFVKLNLAARRSEYDAAIMRMSINERDTNIAAQLGIKCGPGMAAVETAFARANTIGQPVTVPGYAPDSCEALVSIGLAAISRWLKQAAALERALTTGRLSFHRDTFTLYSTGLNGTVRQFPHVGVYALVQLCTVIQANEGKPRAVRITFTGNVHRSVELSVYTRAQGGVVPVSRIATFLPFVRAKIREFHEGEQESNPVGVKLFPFSSFST